MDVRSLGAVTRIAVLCLFAALIATASVAAAYAPMGGDIIYTATDGKLHVARADGAHVATWGVPGTAAKWSPDGNRVAYYYDGDWDNRGLFIRDASGGSLFDVPEMDAGDSYGIYCWSQTGGSILSLFDMGASATITEWWTMSSATDASAPVAEDVFGSHRDYVTAAAPLNSSDYVVLEHPYGFNDDATRRVYGAWLLHVMRADGTIVRSAPLAGIGILEADDPVVSPDGATALFTASTVTGRHDIYAWDLNANTVKRIYAGTGFAAYPRFTADGRWVLFTRRIGSQQATPSVWAMRSNGTGAYRVIAGASDAAPRPAYALPAARRSVLGAPKLSGSARASAPVVFTGRVTPAHVTPVVVEFQRYGTGGYRAYKRVKVTTSASGAWRVSQRLLKGAYRVRAASSPETLGYLRGSASAWTMVVVR